MSNPGQDMEAKLQRMAAGLRRERDEAHRERELASERLRLAKEEEEAAGKTLESMKLKLKELEAASGAGAKNEIEHLKTKVENLENQVSFQHNELLGMREKSKGQQEKHAIEKVAREKIVAKLRETLAKCREKDRKNSKVELKMKSSDARLREELEGDLDNALHSKWPHIVKSKADAVGVLADDLSKNCDVAKIILQGYKRQFGFEFELPVDEVVHEERLEKGDPMVEEEVTDTVPAQPKDRTVVPMSVSL